MANLLRFLARSLIPAHGQCASFDLSQKSSHLHLFEHPEFGFIKILRIFPTKNLLVRVLKS